MNPFKSRDPGKQLKRDLDAARIDRDNLTARLSSAELAVVRAATSTRAHSRGLSNSLSFGGLRVGRRRATRAVSKKFILPQPNGANHEERHQD